MSFFFNVYLILNFGMYFLTLDDFLKKMNVKICDVFYYERLLELFIFKNTRSLILALHICFTLKILLSDSVKFCCFFNILI